MMELVDSARTLILAYGLSVLGGIVILIAGWILAGWVANRVRRTLGRRERFDQTLTGFLAALARAGVLAVVLIVVLGQFGIQTASIIAVLGAAGLAIGLALQGTLSHLAAGVMLMIFRPFRVGQYVELSSVAGTVKEISLVTTELTTPDNVQILVPNGKVWGDVIKNYSHHARRRCDFLLGIAYGDDIGKAMEAIRGVIAQDERILLDPEPQVMVGELADSSVNIIVRVWVNASDLWPVKWDLTRAFKEALDAAGITIPFPQRDLHVHQVDGSGAGKAGKAA